MAGEFVPAGAEVGEAAGGPLAQGADLVELAADAGDPGGVAFPGPGDEGGLREVLLGVVGQGQLYGGAREPLRYWEAARVPSAPRAVLSCSVLRAVSSRRPVSSRSASSARSFAPLYRSVAASASS
ncbi:hypothetical protein SF23_13385 [Streptomyces sp. MBRL 10]|nr:hypothetical protein SF23_13385 [Streptomyces sp. MBRL 10]